MGVVYSSGSGLESITAYLTGDYLVEAHIFPLKNHLNFTVKMLCKTVIKDDIIYGKIHPDHYLYGIINDFIVEGRHLRYIGKHSDEILELLGCKKKA